MKLNAAQENLLKHINTGAYIKTNVNPNTYTVHKAGYYHWLIRAGTVRPFIQDGTLVYDDTLQAYIKQDKPTLDHYEHNDFSPVRMHLHGRNFRPTNLIYCLPRMTVVIPMAKHLPDNYYFNRTAVLEAWFLRNAQYAFRYYAIEGDNHAT